MTTDASETDTTTDETNELVYVNPNLMPLRRERLRVIGSMRPYRFWSGWTPSMRVPDDWLTIGSAEELARRPQAGRRPSLPW